MKLYMKKIFTVLPVLALVLSVSACREEMDPGVDPEIYSGDGTEVQFVVGGSTIDSKASLPAQTGTIKISEEGDENRLVLVVTEESLDNLYSNSADTKGVPNYTENFTSHFTTFGGTAYFFTDGATAVGDLASTDKVFTLTNKDSRTYTNTLSTWTSSANNVMFFMNAPADITSAGVVSSANSPKYTIGTYGGSATGVTTFDYKAPGLSTDGTTQNNPKLLEDILFTSKAISKDEYNKDSHHKNNILFYHALAGVKFKSANAENEKQSNGKSSGEVTTKIKSITLTNIVNGGTCTVTPDPAYGRTDSNAGGSYKSTDACKWTLGTAKSTFSFNANTKTTETSAHTDTFPGVFDGTDNKYSSYNINDTNYDQTFFFVPQTTGSDVKLTVTYTLTPDGGTESPVYSSTVVFSGQNWKAGNLYTYTLSANHVTLEVSDQVTEAQTAGTQTKSGLYIKNTGNVDCYYRVALVGNWYDTHSPYQITKAWDINYGTFDDSFCGDGGTGANGRDGYNAYWYHASDGFYYFKYKVKPGTIIPNAHQLFQSYTIPTKPADTSLTDSHLEIDFIVQAVDANKIDKAGSAWIKDDGENKKLLDAYDE